MVPMNTHPRWEALVTGRLQYTPKLLGLKILMNVVTVNLKKDGSQAMVKHSIEEVRNYFLKYESQLQDDIKHIFG